MKYSLKYVRPGSDAVLLMSWTYFNELGAQEAQHLNQVSAVLNFKHGLIKKFAVLRHAACLMHRLVHAVVLLMSCTKCINYDEVCMYNISIASFLHVKENYYHAINNHHGCLHPLWKGNKVWMHLLWKESLGYVFVPWSRQFIAWLDCRESCRLLFNMYLSKQIWPYKQFIRVRSGWKSSKLQLHSSPHKPIKLKKLILNIQVVT